MNLLEEFKKNPGFVYRIGTDYYYIGKWICKPCTDEAVTDCHAMYEMCIQAKEQANAALYFQKLRAYSEFALDIPYNPAKILQYQTALVEALSDADIQSLTDRASILITSRSVGYTYRHNPLTSSSGCARSGIITGIIPAAEAERIPAGASSSAILCTGSMPIASHALR